MSLYSIFLYGFDNQHTKHFLGSYASYQAASMAMFDQFGDKGYEFFQTEAVFNG